MNPYKNSSDRSPGYLSSQYSQALLEFGKPRELTRCGSWILERSIPETQRHDLMGCYPLFCCRDWSQLHLDLADIDDKFVSLALVTDPFGDYDELYLRKCFRDIVIPFKEHYVVDLTEPIESRLSSKIRYRVRKANRSLQVENCLNPISFLDEWIQLFSNTSQRFSIGSIRAFSRQSYAKIFSIPGLQMFRALHEDKTVGIAFAFIQDNVAYGRQIALSDLGYQLDASYALYWFQIKHLANRCHWLDLGGLPGATANPTNEPSPGLRQFKEHWTRETRTSYFCGRIYNHEMYNFITKKNGLSGTKYFPAYRSGEFGQKSDSLFV